MVMENKQSLEVDYKLLAKECHALAYFLPEVPTQVLEIFNEAAANLVMSTFPRYSNIQVSVKLYDLRGYYFMVQDFRMNNLLCS